MPLQPLRRRGHPLLGQQDCVVVYMFQISNFVKIVLNVCHLSMPLFFPFKKKYHFCICVALPFGEAAAGYFEGRTPITRHVENECIHM